VWLVVSAGLEVDRSHLVAELAAGWTQIDRRDFRSSTAVLLERPRQPGGS